jgi:CRP-like cAMP-binding protein
VFGEIAVFTRVRRTATVEAMEQVTAMEITRDDLERDLGMSDWLGQLIAALAERYREKDRRVAELEAREGPLPAD